MKSVPVQDAIGMVLCHDVTKIIPGKFKGRAFKKGHIIRPEDISTLRDIGKEHVYVWEIQEGFLHEDDAAIRIAKAAAGQGIVLSEPKEGKVELSAESRGLLKINSDALYHINEVDQVICATLHTNQTVTEGKIVAGTRIIPLVIEESKILQVEKICKTRFPLVAVKPFKPHTVGIITTGTEVYHERIKDTFTPVLRNKFSELESTVVQQRIVPDSTELIAQAIAEFTGDGVELIAVTGGMSVDPDDVTHLHELRAVDFKTGLRPDLLGHTGGGIAADGGFRFHYFEIHGAGNFNIDRRTVIEGQLDFHAFLQIRCFLAQHIALDGGLFKGFVIHEVIEITVSIQVGDVVKVETHVLNGLA